MVLVGVLALAVGANAQSQRPCSAVDNVGSVAGKPFTAERVTRSVTHAADGTEKVTELRDLIARDGAGRVRVDRHGSTNAPRADEKVTLNTRDGGTIEATHSEMHLLVMIFDGQDGKTIQLQPAMRIARVRSEECKVNNGPSRPYSAMFKTLAGHALPSNVTFEELGSKEIEGVSADGFRTTTREATNEADLKGKPGISEYWVSDDLAVTMLEIRSDLDGNNTSRSSLIHIKRDEPDSSLFQVPAGYTINPEPKDMPFVGKKP
jgi:hypothetical protein